MGVLAFLGLERRNVVNTWTPAHPITVADVMGSETASVAYAENLSGVLACVNVIAANVASFPLLVYRRDGTARVEVSGHPFTRIVRDGPNPRQTWGALLESAIASVELHGNALVEIIRDGSGTITGLAFVPWHLVTVQRPPSDRLAFDVYQPAAIGHEPRKRRLLADDVLHLKDRSDDGLIGRSRLSRSRDVFLTAGSQQTFARSFLERGAQPSGVISHEGNLTAEQRVNLRDQFTERHQGASNAGRALILDGGLSWQTMQVSPEDAELLASRRIAALRG